MALDQLEPPRLLKTNRQANAKIAAQCSPCRVEEVKSSGLLTSSTSRFSSIHVVFGSAGSLRSCIQMIHRDGKHGYFSPFVQLHFLAKTVLKTWNAPSRALPSARLDAFSSPVFCLFSSETSATLRNKDLTTTGFLLDSSAPPPPPKPPSPSCSEHLEGTLKTTEPRLLVSMVTRWVHDGQDDCNLSDASSEDFTCQGSHDSGAGIT